MKRFLLFCGDHGGGFFLPLARLLYNSVWISKKPIFHCKLMLKVTSFELLPAEIERKRLPFKWKVIATKGTSIYIYTARIEKWSLEMWSLHNSRDTPNCTWRNFIPYKSHNPIQSHFTMTKEKKRRIHTSFIKCQNILTMELHSNNVKIC